MNTHGGTGGFGGPSVPAGESVYHYLHDLLGSVVALTNAAGQVVERYTYDPYGKTVIEETNPATGLPTARLDASAFGNPFAWTGQRYDAGVRLYHFLFRGYSPTLGRWLQRDPVGYYDSISPYEYVAGRATRLRDPLGLSALAGDGGVDYVDPENLEYCRSLAKRINEVQKRICKRVEGLKNNPQDLPETHPDDGECPRLSRRGHRRLIREDIELLNRLKNQYKNRCDGRWPRFPLPEPQPQPQPQPGTGPESPGPIPRAPEIPPVVDPPLPPPVPQARPGFPLPRDGPGITHPPIPCRDCLRSCTPFYPW